jgi:uncharacterized membrane protein
VSERALGGALGALALLGAAVSGYLVWARYSGGELLCSTGGCETVQSSPYAEVLGLPVALLGLGGYLLIAATAPLRSPTARVAGAALALTAVAFSAYLLVVQLAVIDAVCDWCLTSDVIVTLVAAVALLRLRAAV